MWNRAERALRAAYRTGAPLDLGGSGEPRARARATVRASVLAELLLAGPPPRPGRTARVDLAGARITGRLDLTGARIDAPLRLRRCLFDEPLLLDHAELGSVNLDECVLPAVEAESLRVRRWFGMRDARVAGAAWFHHVRVGGALDLAGSAFGGAVNLQRAVVEGDARLGHGAVYAAGLRLEGARVAGDLNIAQASVRAPAAGPAIGAGGVTVGGGLWAHELVADGTVVLIGLRATAAITLQHTTLRHPDGHALLLIEAQTAMLTLRPAPDSAGTISLRDAHVGRLVDDPVGWPAGCQVELAGLTYDRISRRSSDTAEWTARQRLAWMARYGTDFAPGPYDQLAAALRRDGREQEAREVLRVRERLRHRAMGRLGAMWGSVQNVTIGFGYRPARALLWLVAVLGAGSAWFAWSGPLHPVKADEAPTWDPLLYTLDLLVPLVDLGHERAWDPTGADKAVAVLVMAAGWILATTVVAGASRALRR
ncbi:hypothetical protein ABT297_20170 [Dactylosporangium sp. NPDC000555]|uniref:hypothetical protein n=1 Tax=Dactylosporangium sp. NPDC000555 TaxID=3154260 RepID=UPI0033177A40